jgi:hypothetical protein
METPTADRDWYIVSRWKEYEGEHRANVLRIIALAAFYLVELLNHYGLHIGPLRIAPVPGVDDRFHMAITCVALVWVAVALGVATALKQRFFPAALKFASTAADALVLTMLLLVADGPRSPMIIGYFLVVALACLRFSLPLVWFATSASIAGYLVVIANAFWYRQALRVPRYHEIIFLLGLILCGVITGQVIRRVRAMATAYADRLMNSAAA